METNLIEVNVRWLYQALELLERLEDGVYAASPAGFAPHSAGGHLRHIVEFYQCFLNGIESLHIDYDARRRDVRIEKSRAAAAEAILEIIASLRAFPKSDGVVWVRMEDSKAFLVSSTLRELQVLSSHTVHHFALMALTLKLHGVAMEPEFGMAPSTLRYLASMEAA